jgi:hypothetical protein
MTERRKVGELNISSDALLNALTEPDIDGPAILRKMPSVSAQLANMGAAGGDIRVPTGELIRAFSGSGAEDAILPHLRSDPPALTVAQLEQSLAGDGTSSAENALKPGQVSVAPGQNPLQAIRDTAAEVLKANGLRTKVAEATAAIVAVRAQDRAHRLGMDPVELYNEKPLQRDNANRTAEASSGQTLLQAMNAGVDLDQPVAIVPVQPRNWSGEPKAAKIAKFWKSVHSGLRVLVPGLGDVSISATDVGHAISSFKKSISSRAHFDVLAALPEMLKHAVVVESYPDTKNKSGVGLVHRVFVAASIGKRRYAVKLTVFERSDGSKQVDFSDQLRFYDYHIPKEVLTSEQAMTSDVSNPSTVYHTGTATVPERRTIPEGSLTLRDLLSGLKDDAGDPYFQSGKNSDPRGSVTFTDSGPIIRFFQSHDASTAIHELSHIWLEELRSDAMRQNAPQQLRDDWAEAQRYLQLGELAQDAVIPTDTHETFARTGEAYFREGRAPSPQLVGILNQFRDWLRAIYRSLRQLDVEMTPEIRGVFDRLLASDEEIKAMRSPRGKERSAPLRPPVEGAELK